MISGGCLRRALLAAAVGSIDGADLFLRIVGLVESRAVVFSSPAGQASPMLSLAAFLRGTMVCGIAMLRSTGSILRVTC